MKVDWAISTAAHVGLVAVGLVSFSATPFEPPPESLPVDIVSATEYSQVMAGSRKAPKAERPKPLVEKVAEKKIAEDPTPKVSEKPEIKQAKAEPPPPMPERRPKPPPAAEVKKPPRPKVDPIAEALRKHDEKRKREAKKEQSPAEKPQPKRPEPRFEPDKIAALLDKREPRRQVSTGGTLNNAASLGLPSATAARLSQNEMDALRRRIQECWNVPIGAEDAQNLSVVFRVQFNLDGTVAGMPEIVEGTASRYGPVFAESGKRAILRCQPYTMLRRETYNDWKDIEINFDPRSMMRGG